MIGLWIGSVTRERAEDENRMAHLLGQLALMDHARADICSNVMELNGIISRVMMDNIIQRYATLVLPLPPFLHSLASEFLVGPEELATDDLRHLLEVSD